jgi:hypothetical protein
VAKEQAGTEEGRPHVVRRLLAAFVTPSSYGMVLLLIIATYILAASLSVSTQHATTLLLAQAVTVWFALRTSRVRRSTLIAADVLLVLATLIALGVGFGGDTNSTRAGVELLSCLLYLVAPVAIIRHVVSRDTVDVQTMLGAIAAYLMIGMFFAFAYVTVGTLQDGPFFGPQGDGTVPQVLFFSFTTLTTTGYGNLVPAGNPGQSLSVAEMIMGQLFLITALGKVASAWRPRRWSAANPESDVRPQESDASAETP